MATKREHDESEGKAEGLRGFTVSKTTRVSSKRPAATIRSLFFELKRGMAFREGDVAREWAISPETVRRHARDAECFRYVDLTGHDGWEPCVMHPDTAKLYPVK